MPVARPCLRARGMMWVGWSLASCGTAWKVAHHGVAHGTDAASHGMARHSGATHVPQCPIGALCHVSPALCDK